MGKKNDGNTIFKNHQEICEAFDHNPDSSQSAGEKTIMVSEVIWTWTKTKVVERFGQCHARRGHFFPGDILSVICDSVADPHLGTSSELSAAFQIFKFNKSKNCLTVKGDRGPGREYRVEIFFAG